MEDFLRRERKGKNVKKFVALLKMESLRKSVISGSHLIVDHQLLVLENSLSRCTNACVVQVNSTYTGSVGIRCVYRVLVHSTLDWCSPSFYYMYVKITSHIFFLSGNKIK